MNFRLIWAFLAVSALHEEDAEPLSDGVCGRCFSKNALPAMGRTKSRSKRIFDMRTLTRVTKRGESGLKALVLGKPAESPIYLASNPLTATQKPAP